MLYDNAVKRRFGGSSAQKRAEKARKRNELLSFALSLSLCIFSACVCNCFCVCVLSPPSDLSLCAKFTKQDVR